MKVIITGRRRRGTTRAELSHHLRDVHGPMVVAAPGDAGPMPAGYVQNHVTDSTYPESGTDHDFVTELWFDSPRHAGESVQTPYYKNVLQPDEPNFVHQPSVLRCIAGEIEVLGASAPGHQKAFLFLPRAGGIETPAFQEAWAASRAAVLATQPAGVTRWLANVAAPMPGPGGPQPLPFDGIDEFWYSGSAAEMKVLMRAVVEGLGAHVARSEVFYLLAEEFSTERLLAGG